MVAVSSVSSKPTSSLSTCIAENPLSKAISELAQKILRALTAVLDFVLPRNPVTGARQLHLVPTALEKFLGNLFYGFYLSNHGGVVSETDSKYGSDVRMVKRIGAQLAAKSPRKGLDFEFNVTDCFKENAWSVPGGKIGMNIGLIQKMRREQATFGLTPFSIEEKVAAILSHEITHASARHGGRIFEFIVFLAVTLKVIQYALAMFILNQSLKIIAKARLFSYEPNEFFQSLFSIFDKMSGWVFSLSTLGYSRKMELEADKFGMHLLEEVRKTPNQTGLTPNSPQALTWFIHHIKQKYPPFESAWLDRSYNFFFSTHPTYNDRIQANEKTWQEILAKRAAPSA